jgi:hypothetical protein
LKTDKFMKVYKQMKMYNDDDLNPVLYQKKVKDILNIILIVKNYPTYSRHETFCNGRCRYDGSCFTHLSINIQR